jgi:hypothetical protein
MTDRNEEAFDDAKRSLEAADVTTRSDYNGVIPGEEYVLESGETVYVVDREVDRWRNVQLIIENEVGDRRKLRESQLIDRMKEAKL